MQNWRTLPGLLTLFAAVPLAATTIIMPTDQQLVEKSPVVVIATVLSSEAVERDGGIRTESVLSVERALKGETASTIVVREAGGTVGDRATVVFGSPSYLEGERVLVFLWPTSRGEYQTMDLFVGKFTERRAVDGRRIWYRAEHAADTLLLDSKLNGYSATGIQRDGSAFEEFVELEGRGLTTDRPYELRGVVLAGSAVSSDFTLIAEPQRFRWFAFDSGGSVPWRSSGTQPGYSDGGIAELRTGMSSWTGYTSARIRYTYAGATSAPPGGLDIVNGINEVDFNDPRGEIAGSFNRATGGVVGRGGFNSVSGGGSWTSTFTADPAHPRGTFPNVPNILEGNMVIQDGVSPSNGLSSNILAELIAHEFGHTLGFGHSSDDTALMFANITSLGPALRADDQTAARWLYPTSSGGGGTPPAAPRAPSDLRVSARGSREVVLSWTDNASDETSQMVYSAVGSGAFALLGELGADVISIGVNSLSPGSTYRFRITARNGAGESAASNTAEITMPAALLEAAFTVSSTTGSAGITNFAFVDRSTGLISARLWDFGDGSTSSVASPSHVYTAPGFYTVTLTLNGGAAAASRTLTVAAGPSALTASFSFSPGIAAPNVPFQFTDSSTGPVTSRSWRFGDGTTSSEMNPVKSYLLAGTYDVELTVAGTAGSATAVRTVTVAAGGGGSAPVSADFEPSERAPKPDQEIMFFDRSSGSPNSWFWDFGDGGISTLQNPTHKYREAGTFRVTLTAGKSGSSSTSTRTITVATSSRRRLVQK